MTALRMIRDEEPAPYDAPLKKTNAGFAMIPSAVRSLRDPYAKAVYMTLAFHADGELKCWPSRETIASESGCSIRKVDSVLQSLEESGFLTFEKSSKSIRRPRMIYLTRNPKALDNGAPIDVQEMHITPEKHAKSHVQVVHQSEIDMHTVPVDVQEVRIDVHHVPNDVHTVHPNKNQLTRTKNENQEEDIPAMPETPTNTNDKPFDVIEAICEAQGQTYQAIPNSDRGKHCRIAEGLLADGITAKDAGSIVRWLKSTWVKDGVDVFLVKKQAANWRLAGSPDGVTIAKTKNTNHLGLASW